MAKNFNSPGENLTVGGIFDIHQRGDRCATVP